MEQQRWRRRTGVLAVLVAWASFASYGCGGSESNRNALDEVEASLASVRGVRVETCDFEADPEESNFSMYRCIVFVTRPKVRLPKSGDLLSRGRHSYCFTVPRVPRGAAPVDVDARPSWSPVTGRCL